MDKILIVEDDKAISDLIEMNLDMVGYQCWQAYDGEEAVSMVEEVRPDLVLLDVMIPKEDGFTLMRKNVFRDIPVIFVTAKDNVADKVKGLRMGADDYILKPFEAAELLARVEAVLRRTNPRKSEIAIDGIP